MTTFNICLLLETGEEFSFDDSTCWLLDQITVKEVAQACGKVEISLDGVVWTDVSGQTQTIDGVTQDRKSEEYWIFDNDLPLTGTGRREPIELNVSIIYTETDAEVYEVVRHRFEDINTGATLYIRFSPAGGNAGDEMITSDEGILTGFIYPPPDASVGGVIMGGFTLIVPEFATTIVAS